MLHELATNTRRATLAHELADEMWNERAKTATNLLGPDHLQALSRMAGREEQWLQTHRSKEAAAYSNAVLAHQAALPPEQRHAAFGGEWSREASAPNESAKRDEEKIAGWFSKAKPKPKSTLTAGDVLIMSLAGGTTVGIGKLIDRYMGKTEITIPPLKWKVPEYIPDVRPLPLPPPSSAPSPEAVPVLFADALQSIKSAAPNLLSTAGGVVGGTALGALASEKETQGRNTALGGLGGGLLGAILSHATDVREHTPSAITKRSLGTIGKASLLGAAGIGSAALAHKLMSYPGSLAGSVAKYIFPPDAFATSMKSMGYKPIPSLGSTKYYMNDKGQILTGGAIKSVPPPSPTPKFQFGKPPASKHDTYE